MISFFQLSDMPFTRVPQFLFFGFPEMDVIFDVPWHLFQQIRYCNRFGLKLHTHPSMRNEGFTGCHRF